ncbi:hypothetical protein Tco_1287936 [Tanacetum coccineum]
MCVQCLEMASEFTATPSELASDDVNILVTASERNRLNEVLEDSTERRLHDSCTPTWMTFGGNTHDLDSIWEETDEITTLHEVPCEKGIQWLETAPQIMLTASGGSSDGVKTLVMASEVFDLKETLRRFAG